VSYCLACNSDPRVLGIERPDGSWDMAAFERHVATCATCRSFANRLQSELATLLQTGRPGSADLTISAGAELIIREVIDILGTSQIARARQLLEALLRAQARQTN
jgi:hypothetical protein